ncbi:MAG: transporter substrate-binding domain-containing protein [Ignavibacteriales bacterium]
MKNQNFGFLGTSVRRASHLVRRNVLLVTIMSIMFMIAVGVQGVQRTQKISKTLMVGVYQEPPFSMKNQAGAWEGINVDLWKEIAKELNMQYQFREMAIDALLAGAADGSIDVVVGPLAITLEREKIVDFSVAFYTSGLGIAVPEQSESDRWLNVVRAFFSMGFLQILSVIVILLLLAGYVVWLFERKRNPKQFGDGRWSGIGAGLWWSSVTLTGVGYGDKVPITLGGRIIAIVWMFSSFALFSGFTASVTARLAVSHFEQIRNRENLQHRLVATVEGSASEEYLRRNHIRLKAFPTGAAAIDAVSHRKVDAFVYNEPTLKYIVNHENRSAVEILPEIMESRYFAFALPQDSSLRESLNRAILKITAQPLWRDIQYRYLGQ